MINLTGALQGEGDHPAAAGGPEGCGGLGAGMVAGRVQQGGALVPDDAEAGDRHLIGFGCP